MGEKVVAAVETRWLRLYATYVIVAVDSLGLLEVVPSPDDGSSVPFWEDARHFKRLKLFA
ncbi:MAG: hypothetical protein K0R38_2705 [Polyangiaceae bacterium]|nr:hypothetical protein [Polyangiaceae bacterium]